MNYLKNNIYGKTTMKTYQQQIGYYGDWLISKGLAKISVDEAKTHIQEYMDYLKMTVNRQILYIQHWRRYVKQQAH